MEMEACTRGTERTTKHKDEGCMCIQMGQNMRVSEGKISNMAKEWRHDRTERGMKGGID